MIDEQRLLARRKHNVYNIHNWKKFLFSDEVYLKQDPQQKRQSIHGIYERKC